VSSLARQKLMMYSGPPGGGFNSGPPQSNGYSQGTPKRDFDGGGGGGSAGGYSGGGSVGGYEDRDPKRMRY